MTNYDHSLVLEDILAELRERAQQRSTYLFRAVANVLRKVDIPHAICNAQRGMHPARCHCVGTPEDVITFIENLQEPEIPWSVCVELMHDWGLRACDPAPSEQSTDLVDDDMIDDMSDDVADFDGFDSVDSWTSWGTPEEPNQEEESIPEQKKYPRSMVADVPYTAPAAREYLVSPAPREYLVSPAAREYLVSPRNRGLSLISAVQLVVYHSLIEFHPVCGHDLDSVFVYLTEPPLVIGYVHQYDTPEQANAAVQEQACKMGCPYQLVTGVPWDDRSSSDLTESIAYIRATQLQRVKTHHQVEVIAQELPHLRVQYETMGETMRATNRCSLNICGWCTDEDDLVRSCDCLRCLESVLVKLRAGCESMAGTLTHMLDTYIS